MKICVSAERDPPQKYTSFSTVSSVPGCEVVPFLCRNKLYFLWELWALYILVQIT